MSSPWTEFCSLQDASIHQFVVESVKRSGLAAHLHSLLRREVERPGVRRGDIEETTRTFIKTTGLDVQVKNLVYQALIRLNREGCPLIRMVALEQYREPLDFVRAAQEDWLVKLRHKINSLSVHVGLPLSRERSFQEREMLRKKWSSIGSRFPDKDPLFPLFVPTELLEALMSVIDPNHFQEDEPRDLCGVIKVQVKTESLFDVRRKYSKLHPSVAHVECTQNDPDCLERTKKVLNKGLFPLAAHLCKTGCPVGSRRDVWAMALGLDLDKEKHSLLFSKLKSSVLRYNVLLERLIVKDVKKIIANDDSYFVFEDTIHQVMLTFLHDTSVVKQLHYSANKPFKASICGKIDESDHEVIYPPNGIVPFQGLSLFVAPLCYVSERTDRLLTIFTAMYTRYFCHLHSISSNSEGILGLCCLFERLLVSRSPLLFQHLKKIRAEPLFLVFKWLVWAFVGFLDSSQVLLLWDRVIGFNSLDILAVLAVAILEFRATNLFRATSLSEAEAMLQDIKCLKVMPLVQQTLFT